MVIIQLYLHMVKQIVVKGSCLKMMTSFSICRYYGPTNLAGKAGQVASYFGRCQVVVAATQSLASRGGEKSIGHG
jgi:hypothetical protein